MFHQRFDAGTDKGNFLSAFRTLFHTGLIGLHGFGLGIVNVSLALTNPSLGAVEGH